MNPSHIEILATALFALAVTHTFLVSRFEHWAGKFPDKSVPNELLHLFGEVEVVFGLWGSFLFAGIAVLSSWEEAVHYLEGLNFTEPAFVFAIMVVAATRPVVTLATAIITRIASLLPIPSALAFYTVALIVGPLLGSLITEPAAVTVTAMVMRERYFAQNVSARFRYVSLGTLLVNVSVGGVLTHFAAPPVLMVARHWGWDTPFMLEHFGWRAVIAVVLNVGLAVAINWKELRILSAMEDAADVPETETAAAVPLWLTLSHVVALGALVAVSHHLVLIVGVVLFFLGWATVTFEHQTPIKLRESLMVAFFLGGLVVLGSLQAWWLAPLIGSLSEFTLYVGASALTAITDNAALTYLGSQVPNIGDSFKYALVAGAVTGGGLTVIANAPNPAAFAILRDTFGPDGIGPMGLFAAALPATLIVGVCFWAL